MRNMFSRTFISAVLLMSVLGGAALATTEDKDTNNDAERILRLEAELAELRAEQKKNHDRIEALVAEVGRLSGNVRTMAAMPVPPAAQPGLRARFDVLTRFSSERFPNALNELTNNREGSLFFRVRAHLDGQISRGLTGGLQLTTGGNPNPTSPFIRLTGAATSKTFNLGRAFLAYHPFKNYQDLSFTFGKMPNPIWRGDFVGNHNSELIWDDDVNPEGFSLYTPVPLQGRLKNRLKLSNTLAFFLINNPTEERFLGFNKETTLLVNQLVAEYQPVKLGIGFYDYQGLNSGLRARAFAVPLPGDPFGATFDVLPSTDAFLLRPGLQTTNHSVTYGAGSHGFVSDRFTTANITGQYNFPQWFNGKQLYFLFDGVQNFRVRRDRRGTSYTLGGRTSDQEKTGAWNTWLTYRSVDADATLATFADSDLGIGTDYRGFEIGGALRIQPRTTLQVSFFRFNQFPFKHLNRSRLFVDILRAF